MNVVAWTAREGGVTQLAPNTLGPTPAHFPTVPNRKDQPPRVRGVANRLSAPRASPPRARSRVTFYHVTLDDASTALEEAAQFLACACSRHIAHENLPSVQGPWARHLHHERATWTQLVAMQGLDGAHRASVLAHVHEGKLFHDGAAHDRAVGREEGCQLLWRRIRPVDIAHKDLHLDAAAAFPERRELSYSDRQNVRTTRSPPQEWLATENPAAQAL